VNNQPLFIIFLIAVIVLCFANIFSIQIDLEVVHKLQKVKQGTSTARDETEE
jgi:hypothetical protein